jgi:hypothetical protein
LATFKFVDIAVNSLLSIPTWLNPAHALKKLGVIIRNAHVNKLIIYLTCEQLALFLMSRLIKISALKSHILNRNMHSFDLNVESATNALVV